MADNGIETETDGVTVVAEPELAHQRTAPDTSVQDESAQEDGDREVTAADLAGEENWIFLLDPAWQATTGDEEPPPEAVVGGWFVDEDGGTGYFLPNPDYESSAPGLPTDPVDAVIQLVILGEADGDELLEATRDVIFGVAVDEEGFAVVAQAPDQVPSVLATTAPKHRERVNAPGWREVTVEELAAALPDEGIDVLLNPGAPASMRIIADALKSFVAGGESPAADDLDEAAGESVGAGPDTEEVPGADAISVVSADVLAGRDAGDVAALRREDAGVKATASASSGDTD